ncbi:MAG: sulfatase [Verrucomicrobiota bacterium]
MRTLALICSFVCSIGFAAERPNILFLAIDDLRPEVGAYGVDRAVTPSIDEFAKTALRFHRAYVTYPLCLPSRASMLTGKRIDFKGADKGVGFEGYIERQATWPQTFRSAGYWTATTGKIYHGNVPNVDLAAWDIPGDFWKINKDWSPEIMAKVTAEGGDAEALAAFKKSGKGGGALIWQAIDGDDDILNDGRTATEAIRLLKERPSDQPFVICAGFSRPHMPWLAPKKYFDLYEDAEIDLAAIPEGNDRVVRPEDAGSGVGKNNAQWNEGVSDEEARGLIKGYLASTSYADAQAGRILEALDEEGLTDNTIVVIWGDHGYHLTDHGLWRKNTIYHVANRVPLLIRVPGKVAGKVTNRIVESIDLYPTLLGLAGVDEGELQLDGRNLTPLLDDPKTEWKHAAFISGGDSHGLVNTNYRFSMSSKRPPELYDLKADPDEWTNLAQDPAHTESVQQFSQKVRRVWKLQAKP